jgi:hypothetical protein
MTNRNAFLLLLLCAITWGCANSPPLVPASRSPGFVGAAVPGSWRAERSISNSTLPVMPPDSERSRWVTRMER